MTELKRMFNEHKAIMTAYKTDIDVDEQTITDNPNVDFILFNRGSGTSLLLMYSADNYPIKEYETVKYLFGHVNRLQHLEEETGLINYYLKNKPVKISFYSKGKVYDMSLDKAAVNIDHYKRHTIDIWNLKKQLIAV